MQVASDIVIDPYKLQRLGPCGVSHLLRKNKKQKQRLGPVTLENNVLGKFFFQRLYILNFVKIFFVKVSIHSKYCTLQKPSQGLVGERFSNI